MISIFRQIEQIEFRLYRPFWEKVISASRIVVVELYRCNIEKPKFFVLTKEPTQKRRYFETGI